MQRLKDIVLRIRRRIGLWGPNRLSIPVVYRRWAVAVPVTIAATRRRYSPPALLPFR